MTTRLLDTSVFIAAERGRHLDPSALDGEIRVRAITIGELHAGVLAASSVDLRSRRMSTLAAVSTLEPLMVDDVVAREWARLRALLVENGRRMGVNDLWIAATASAHGMSVVTQDRDFDALNGLGEPEVIFV